MLPRYCSPTHDYDTSVYQGTRVQSADTYVASDIGLTRPLGAGKCARIRGGEAEGRQGGGGSAVQPGLRVSEGSGRWDCGLTAGHERQIAHGGCRAGTFHPRVSRRSPNRGTSLRSPDQTSICECQPCAEEGVALLEKAAGQGHAYAMEMLESIYHDWKEYEQALKWATKGAEAGLPKAMFILGCRLNAGEGTAPPEYQAAADWYRCAADAGCGSAAQNLSKMYLIGRGWAWQTAPATSSFIIYTIVS
jgi:hypothetical protein